MAGQGGYLPSSKYLSQGEARTTYKFVTNHYQRQIMIRFMPNQVLIVSVKAVTLV